MRNPVRIKTRITAIRRPFVVKGLLVLFLLCIFIKAFTSMVSVSLPDSTVSRLLQNSEIAGGILSFELGSPERTSFGEIFTGLFPGLGTLIGSGEPSSHTVELYSGTDEHVIRSYAPPPGENTQPNQPNNEAVNDGLFYTENPQHSPNTAEQDNAGSAETPDAPNTIIRRADGILLDNTTGYAIDIEALLNKPLGITLTPGEPAVLIIHTHTSEAYTKSSSDDYVESDPFRTEDKSKNIVRVGVELASELEKRGIGVIHDSRSYDYPSYTGSYNRTYASVQAYMKQYPSIKLVIDLHRDSITAADGSQYKTLAQIGDDTCSQVMFVVGSDAAGLKHPSWQDNLSLALHLQSEMNSSYPTLARPVRISQYRYNQQLSPGALILEVGCAGNTLEQSITAVRYFADAAANVFLQLYE